MSLERGVPSWELMLTVSARLPGFQAYLRLAFDHKDQRHATR